MGATLGMMARSFRMRMEHARAIVPQRGRECTVTRKNRVDARPLAPGQAVIRPASEVYRRRRGPLPHARLLRLQPVSW